ncbi:hypothetical protein [Aliiroseovarius sp. 2305UL8-7]|uniref:hypothetical protein n=1 Tax=Aliiroseovarius conchicola TaxID=3121637 RepID=UPI003527751E
MTDIDAIFKWADANRDDPKFKGSEGATLIGVHGETLRTRIRTGKARAVVQPAGETRSNLSYSLSMMVHNLLFHHLAKFSEELNFDDLSRDYLDEVLVKGKKDIWLELKCLNGEWTPMSLSERGQPDLSHSHEPIFLMPIGVMISKLVLNLHAKAGNA